MTENRPPPLVSAEVDLRGMTYAQQLRHPLWQRRRLQVFQLANFTCVRCGSTSRELHAHHKTYIRDRLAWEYPDNLLECLCDPCHDKAHENLKRLELTVAQQPSALLPNVVRLMGSLGAAMSASSRAERVDAMNRLQDELDGIEDFRRGAGAVDITPYLEQAQPA